MLSRKQILALLNDNKLFLPGTWSADNLRATGYDLRMAYDYMIVPDPPGYPTGRRHHRGDIRIKEAILQPGDVAFVSTLERLAIPWNIAGNIGSKFSLSAQGLLLLTGLIVDPGYGLVLNGQDEWVPKEDVRLHFLLANVGPGSVVLTPGKTLIGAIQFYEVSEPDTRPTIKSIGAEAIQERFFSTFSPQDVGLVFFRNMADLSEHVKEYDLQIKSLERRMSAVESGSNQILLFGIYLLSATILGVSFASILSVIANMKLALSPENAMVVAVGFVIIGIMALYMTTTIIRAYRHSQGLSRNNSSTSTTDDFDDEY